MELSKSLDQQKIHHFSHEHPLNLTEIKHDDEILCCACKRRCSGQTYVCCSSSHCKFFLHNSCYDLPRKIRHPFHPHHPLTLYSPIQGHSDRVCKVCQCFCLGFAYSCNYCRSFWMDVQCPVMMSSVQYEGHCHNILFIDALDPCQIRAIVNNLHYKAHAVFLCSACDTCCEPWKPWFRCVKCDFNLHFECGPLPCFISNKENHPCPLKLTISPVMVDGGDKGGDWFICDICEEERDPRLPVYYCSNSCAYIAEVKCVMSEIRASLSGEYGEVELRSSIFPHKAGNAICKDVVKRIELASEDREDSYPDEDQVEDRDIEVDTLEGILGYFQGKLSYVKETEGKDFSSSNEDYAEFIALMDKGATMLQYFTPKCIVDNGCLTSIVACLWGNNAGEHDKRLALLRGNKKSFVNFGNYSVSSDLAPTLEELCTKYGDFIPKSTSGDMNFFVCSLCETIQGMCTTRVADIPKAKLFSWWRCLKALRSKGFKVQFALDRLKRVVDACYALQVEKRTKKDSEQMDREIAKVSSRIKELEENLAAGKAKLVALEDTRKRILGPQKPESAGMVAVCFKEAAELRWMMAGDGLL